MKKILSFILVTILAFCLVSCANVDIDLRSAKNIYDSLATYINNQDAYEGKSIALTATHTVVYNFSENKINRHSLMEYDASGEKVALYEIRTNDGNYPTIGATVTVFGIFRDGGYIEVEKFEKATINTATYDIEATDFSVSELNSFIDSFKEAYDKSEHYGKTIRIYGHCDSKEGYNYLLGLNESGAYLWDIELYDPSGKLNFPQISGTTVNPVEIIGKLSTYVEDNITYACIEVQSVTKVQSVFKNEVAK